VLALGFPSGSETREAGVGNLGLNDRASRLRSLSILVWSSSNVERLALRWVQQYITAFGGDPTKVMLCVSSQPFYVIVLTLSHSWGQSAGSISVGMQMITNNGDTEGLFRSAFLESGYMHSTGSLEDAQQYWDIYANAAGCGDSLGSAVVFDCLRNASTETLRTAAFQTPNYNSFEVCDFPSFSIATNINIIRLRSLSLSYGSRARMASS
jgi:acetylcholinesterase